MRSSFLLLDLSEYSAKSHERARSRPSIRLCSCVLGIERRSPVCLWLMWMFRMKYGEFEATSIRGYPLAPTPTATLPVRRPYPSASPATPGAWPG